MVIAASLVVTALHITAADQSHRSFDIPADVAEKSLKRFSEQAGLEVLFPTRLAKGVRTGAVKGEMSPMAALTAMLANTGLVVVQDPKTRAFSVRREGNDPNAQRAALNDNSDRPVNSADETPRANARVGVIRGRVFNPVTGEYVRNAEVRLQGTNLLVLSEDDGSFALHQVPPGDTTLTVKYAGYPALTETFTVPEGGTASREIHLAAPVGTRTADGTITLQQFIVSSDREGNAKAIMDQRAALNFKNVVASDTFGDVTDGNVGHFLKHMPGIVIDYSGHLPRAARIGGLDPKYTGVTIDGVSVAGAASATFAENSRGTEFDSLSLNSIEAVEVNKTLTANMDAGSPAGNINMRSKNAFDRKGRQFAYQIGTTFNDWVTRHRLNAKFEYADVFWRNRLGIQFNVGYSSPYTPQSWTTHTFDFSNAERGPVINQIDFRTGGETITTIPLGLNVDFKASDKLTFSWRSTYGWDKNEIHYRTWSFIASPADVLPQSTLTNIVTRPNAANTRLESRGDPHRNKTAETLTISPRVRFKADSLEATVGVDYSKATAEYTIADAFNLVRSRLTLMSWTGTRSGPGSYDWQMSQLSGRPWDDPANFNRDSANANNVNVSYNSGHNERWAAYADLTKDLVARLPVKLRAGLKSNRRDFALVRGGNQNWTYVGPSRSQTAADAVLPITPGPWFPADLPDNINDLGLPLADQVALYKVYQEHPDYFTADTFGNYMRGYVFPRSIREEIDAAYISGATRAGKLRAELGLRYEGTETIGERFKIRPASVIRTTRPDLVPGTIPYLEYQYHDGEQDVRSAKYDNLFLSGGAKYGILPNLNAQLAFSEAILRPSYNNLAGTIALNDTTRIATVPNVNLKPETSTKYFAGVQYYFEPAGTLSFGAYVLDIKDIMEGGITITQEEAGYGDEREYDGYTFLTSRNGTGSVKHHGWEAEYNQQLVFLPEPFKGLSVFTTMTRVIADQQRVNVVNRAASGGLGYRYKRFSARVNATWTKARLTAIMPTATTWNSPRTMVDATVTFRIMRNVDLMAYGRNIFDEPFEDYMVYDGQHYEMRRSRYGTRWTFAIKGTF